jgi:hypothetical protein
LQCTLQHNAPKKAEFDSECLCFDEFPEWRFELAAKLQTEKLSGDLQYGEFLAGFQFREQFLPLQLREDAAQCLQKFVHWEVSFEETFYLRFVLLALRMSRGFAIDQNHIGFRQVGESHL